jgi:hypothetical protein
MRKFLPYILIFVVLAGLFGAVGKVSAQQELDDTLLGTCYLKNPSDNKITPWVNKTQKWCHSEPYGNIYVNWERNQSTPTTPPTDNPNIVRGSCKTLIPGSTTTGTSIGLTATLKWVPEAECTQINLTAANGGAYVPNPPWHQTTQEQFQAELTALNAEQPSTQVVDVDTRDAPKSDFEAEIAQNSCVLLNPLEKGSSLKGCFVEGSYYLFYVIPSFFLYISAYIFNVLIFITLNGALLSKGFVSEAWGVVRDLSNIFFILILLYIAIRVIIGMGGHGVKQMIARVVIMALLINFSMFFTKIVIDSSNILALVFYNKIEVNKVDSQGNVRPYPKTGYNEKDAAGALVDAFNPTKLVSQDFLNSARILDVDINGNEIPNQSNRVAPGILIGMIILSGILMLFASYCLLVAGLSFLGRLIELFVLIIFSPFAFMSSTVPRLEGMEYLGWKSWIQRLIDVSFMAPIFMFFMYFIFMLIHSKIFDGLVTATKTKIIESILSIVLPALLILILLLKATEFAKKGSGKFGEVVISTAKLATSLAVGGTALGVAAAGRATVGTTMKKASLSEAAERFSQYKAGTIPLASLSFKDKTFGALGHYVNKDQEKVEHSAHARHELDKEAAARFDGKKFNQLTGTERNTIRQRISRDHEGERTYGKTYDKLNALEKAAVNATLGIDNLGNAIAGGIMATRTSAADKLINDAKKKQTLSSSVLQSIRTGTYDVRNLANVMAKEQGTVMSKTLSGLTGLIAGGMRGGFKKMGINTGNIEGKFLQDLGSTISEALKNVKINIDLSNVGEVKKEDSHGGGHGGGHH